MTTNPKQSEDTFNLKEFINLAFSNKYSYLISIVVFVCLAYGYNRLVPTTYQVNSVIGPTEDGRSSLLQTNDYFSGMASRGQAGNIEDDINSLKSFSLVSKTVEELNLELSYYRQPLEFLNSTKLSHLKAPAPIYGSNTYIVKMDKSHPQAINTPFYIDIVDENSFRLKVYSDEATLYNYLDNQIISSNNAIEFDSICSFNQTINAPEFKFSVSLNKENYTNNLGRADSNDFFFEFNHIDMISRHYLGKLKVEPVSVRSTLIEVKLQGENLDLTVDFLNTYVRKFLNDNLSEKNNIAINTINFIDSQLSDISDSLVKSESELSNFRATNQVTDLNYQGQQALAQVTQVENEISTLKAQEKYYNYILDYFNNNQDITGLIPPSSANVNDPIMNSMILDLLTLNSERLSILSNKAEKSLFLGQVENKINVQKRTIIENVKNNLNALELSLNENDYKYNKLTREISRLPRTELNMVSMERQFNVSDAIYTFLLQKRSEAAISMASNAPDFIVLEPARKVTSRVVAPKTAINYLLALFFGFFIPTLILILKGYFNQKISSVKDIENVTNKPILNLIYTNYHNTERVAIEYPNSALAESFRSLRSNIFLKINKSPEKAILVTSSLPQDGKSFISFNLAVAIAAVGHKTLIIDCDLRKPTLHYKFKVDNNLGLSNYLCKEMSPEEIIYKSDINNLYFIPAGPILSNASELIEAGKLDEIISFYKNEFDYVIIDSTPIGIVSDATALMKYANYTLMVCRNNYTNKNIFFKTLNKLNMNHHGRYEIVFNDLDVKKSSYQKYNSYYINPKK